MIEAESVGQTEKGEKSVVKEMKVESAKGLLSIINTQLKQHEERKHKLESAQEVKPDTSKSD